jgi:hypothetical protein
VGHNTIISAVKARDLTVTRCYFRRINSMRASVVQLLYNSDSGSAPLVKIEGCEFEYIMST